MVIGVVAVCSRRSFASVSAKGCNGSSHAQSCWRDNLSVVVCRQVAIDAVYPIKRSRRCWLSSLRSMSSGKWRETIQRQQYGSAF